MDKEVYRIIATYSFLKGIYKFLDTIELKKFENFKSKLKSNPYLGDQIRVKFVREFKTNKGKRLYFIIDKHNKIIKFIAYSNKKEQKNVIERIFRNLHKLKN